MPSPIYGRRVPRPLRSALALLTVLVPAVAFATHGSGHAGNHGDGRGLAPLRDFRATPNLPFPVLPDSVLVQVGHGPERQRLTVREFREASVKLGANPDSLTPQQAREFLETLIDQKALVATLALEPRRWTAADSVDFAGFRDQLLMRAALDSAFAAERIRRGLRPDSMVDGSALGAELRDATLEREHVTYDDAALARFAKAFDALPRATPEMNILQRARALAKFPALAPEDSAVVLATLKGEPYTGRDLLRFFRNVRTLGRPHLATADDVRMFANNGLFERVLRREAARIHLLDRPQLREELRRHAEFLDMQRAIARRVTERIPQDSLTLQREFTLSRSRWVLPAKATLVRFVLNTRREADSMAVLMRRPGGIDTLLARGDRAEVDYRETFYSSMGDSALVHRALAVGVGVLVGPEEYGGGWAVWQALSAEPGRDRTFAEARSLVLKDWLDRETGRRLALELQGMRRDRGVGRNEPAIARLLTSSRPR